MFEMKSSERWLFYFLHDSIAAAGSASGSSAGMIYAGGKKRKTLLYDLASCQVIDSRSDIQESK
ncbi:MAG: hypothetical protein ACLUQK_06910 [Clostridium sp.]|uniref:hypothetical protein n=1 Tax=Clostridium innocuum TaxID=1522 RepID=UPI001AF4275F|nr:hypothetical protein [[Clostridium] innocuum]MCC2832608.1 hypothetical protein [[Clostridium] innocuum]MCR0207025.1 hypothetical protein [[Clostridium] innocuum]MCR0259643.1 hypothetical protein [[Clostridium] innocuum]QSI25712.1 hypothetical protein GKZ87_09615 [Erysipelotrichaceae bacterium 66202529]